MSSTKREAWIDWLRMIACFMVMTVHSTEPFYLGGDGSLVLTQADALWASFFDSVVRCCVPLFVVASSYLQFPIHYSSAEFLKKRAARILLPFLFWTIVYALIWGEPVQNFKDLVFNFNYAAGHLWFVYMILGVYALMPLLSPWAEKVGKRELQVYLGIWVFTLFIPFIREAMGGELAVSYGPSGIPNFSKYPLWGECSWNSYGTFYYMSGFIGYMLLGLYLRKFAADLPKPRTIWTGILSYLTGFAICFGGFVRRVFASADGVFPVGGKVDIAVGWETPWCFDTIGTALMTLGLILLIRMIKSEGRFYKKIVLPVSKASYGMYLLHMVILAQFSHLWRSSWGIGAEGAFGIWTTPIQIILTALCSYVCVALSAVLLQRIPKIGKYIIG